MKRPDRNRLEHIQQAGKEILEFIEDKSKEEFYNDRILQRAVERELEIIGEAANNLSEDSRQQMPEIPWKDIIGMRNILIHVYFKVDLETVWETIQGELPELIKTVENQLN